MANKYFSRERRFWSHYIGVQALTAKTDYSFIFDPSVTYLLNINQQSLNDDSNFIVRNVGLFSNFADGLVWKHPERQLFARINVKTWSLDATVFTGTNFTSEGSTFAVTGTGTNFAAEGMSAGDYFTDSDYIYKAGAAITATSIETVNPVPMQKTSSPLTLLKKLTQVGSTEIRREIEISELNSLIPYDEYFTPGLVAGADFDAVSLEVSLTSNTVALEFLTDSIDPAFNSNDITFNFCADLEYTAR